MTFPSLAIIGTAGRKEDKDKLTVYHWDKMVKRTVELIEELSMDRETLKVVSGGAAWADQIAVTLALIGVIKYENLTLYLPAKLGTTGFFGDTERAEQTASTCNYYHSLFSKTTGWDSISHIREVGVRGATLDPGNGSFHARNAMVAKAVSPDGALLAFTFGPPDTDQAVWSFRKCGPDVTADRGGVKDGGTAHTWNTAKCTKFHALIGPAGPDKVFMN